MLLCKLLLLALQFFCYLVLLLFLVLDLPLFCCLVLDLPLVCRLSFFILKPLLFCCLVLCPLQFLDLQLGLSLLLVLGPTPPHLASTAFRTFKQALSDKPLHCSTSLREFFCPFPPLGSLPDKINRKRTLDIAFINTCSFAGSHA